MSDFPPYFNIFATNVCEKTTYSTNQYSSTFLTIIYIPDYNVMFPINKSKSCPCLNHQACVIQIWFRWRRPASSSLIATLQFCPQTQNDSAVPSVLMVNRTSLEFKTNRNCSRSQKHISELVSLKPFNYRRGRAAVPSASRFLNYLPPTLWHLTGTWKTSH